MAEQPFLILTMLLERPGQVVTREQVCKRLWPNDTIAEFEHSTSAYEPAAGTGGLSRKSSLHPNPA